MPIAADEDRMQGEGMHGEGPPPFAALPDPTFQLTDCLPQMVWSARADGARDYFNAQWYAFTGADRGSTDGEAWLDMLHPDDRPLAMERWRQCLETGEPFEAEYRLRYQGSTWRWILARALPVRDADGAIGRWIGTYTDIEDRKRLEQEYQLLSSELRHRIENIFTVVGSLLALSARDRPDAREFAEDLGARLNALRNAQDLLRLPGATETRDTCATNVRAACATPPARLHQLLERLFAPHPAWQAGRIRVEGDDVPLGEIALTPLALLFHELATNALKYGALSTDGQVSVDCRREGGRLRLCWTETGGPPVEGPPERTGFGTDLSTLSIRRQLGGELERRWKREGLQLLATVPLSRLG